MQRRLLSCPGPWPAHEGAPGLSHRSRLVWPTTAARCPSRENNRMGKWLQKTLPACVWLCFLGWLLPPPSMYLCHTVKNLSSSCTQWGRNISNTQEAALQCSTITFWMCQGKSGGKSSWKASLKPNISSYEVPTKWTHSERGGSSGIQVKHLVPTDVKLAPEQKTSRHR